MIESGYDYICDEVWYVYAPESKRRELLKNQGIILMKNRFNI